MNGKKTSQPYWTHNTAYHKWILSHAKGKTNALDVGCGDGLLVRRLSDVCRFVTGIDKDEESIRAAEKNYGNLRNVCFSATDFNNFKQPAASFDLIVFAASLHHMDQFESIKKAKELLSPGGTLLIVGCARRKGLLDFCIEALRLLPAKIGSYIHGEKNGGNIGVLTAEPTLSLSCLRSIFSALLPGAKIHLGLYYRYLLSWVNPKED